MSERRADLDPMTRAVSDALDELLCRHHGIMSSWSNPESFLKWLGEGGYEVCPIRREAADEERGQASDLRVTYDAESCATYVYLTADVGVASTIILSDSVMVDVDRNGEPVGVEVLGRRSGQFPDDLSTIPTDDPQPNPAIPSHAQRAEEL